MNKSIKFYRSLWGVDLNFQNITSVKDKLTLFKHKGFEGLEIATGFFDKNNISVMKNILHELNMGVITQIHTMGYPILSQSVQEHFDDYRRKVEDANDWEPKIVNCHTGRDDWSLDQNFELVTKISDFEKSLNLQKFKIKITHETHRQRILFNPQVSYQIMKHFPNLNITADLSHWIVVNSRLCNEETDRNWKEIIEIISKNSVLIHARVSSPDQIQVINPFAQSNKENLDYYVKIWQEIYKNTKHEILYVVPEYGPAPYLIVDPNTNEPYYDLNEVVEKSLDYMKNKVFI